MESISPLPIGSFLDIERNVFYWQPGVGYLGEYELVFLEKDADVGIKKITFLVKITPKY